VTVGWAPAVILPLRERVARTELDAVLAHERNTPAAESLWFMGGALNRVSSGFIRGLVVGAQVACWRRSLHNVVVARGHDPRDYSEYLLHQARAIGLAGGRLPLAGSTMGEGSLSMRISRLLEARPVVEVSRRRAALATVLCAFAITALTSCQLGRVEKATPGQPPMNELEHRQAAENMQYEVERKALVERARALTPEEAAALLAKVKENPEDRNTY